MKSREMKRSKVMIAMEIIIYKRRIVMAIQKFTVSSDDSIYEAWPDRVKTEGGKLICVFTECTAHQNREKARVVITESTDRG